MDADEAFARMLQEEELRAAGALQPVGDGGDSGIAAFQNRLNIMIETALRCEDHGLQERARAVMPLARLRAAAEETAALAGRLGPDVEAPAAEDLLARGLLEWFKGDFFTWVDTLPCDRCGSATVHTGTSAQPLPEDLAAGATRVELHRCDACGHAMRFPRYNSPAKLLQPDCRRGRCGEWANAFLLCCRAAGLTARYVSDWSDHVWTEYYSHRMRRWVHLDSCEASYDQPLLYESGWGKQVAYVVAAGAWGAVDVTARYTDRWRREVVHQRTLVPERWLARQVDGMTALRRAAWPSPRRLVWLGRDAEERVELLRRRLGMPAAGQAAAGASQALPGRQTGSLEWRQQRGETGLSAPSSANSSAAARSATTYRLAPDGPRHLPPVFQQAGRLSGGACRAAGHNETSEVVQRLFDGRTCTKWLDFGGGGVGGSSWVEYRLPKDAPAVALTGYELVSANDCPERDPAEWRLEGVTETDFATGDVDRWTSLDSQASVRFPARHTALAFHLPRPSEPCRRLRLAISATADPRAANSVQLACWNLYGRPCPTETQPDAADAHSSDETAATSAGAASASGRIAEGSKGSKSRSEGRYECEDGLMARLQAAVEKSAGTPAGQPRPDQVAPEAVALLTRLLDNIRRQPQEAKFRKVRYVKVQQLMDSPLLKELLLSYIGLRPLLMPAPAEAQAGTGSRHPQVPTGEDVFLVLGVDRRGAELKRIAEVLAILPQQ